MIHSPDITPANLVTPKEASDILRIPLPTVYYLLQHGQLPGFQIGGRWKINKDLLDTEVLKKDKEEPQAIILDIEEPAVETLVRRTLAGTPAKFNQVLMGTSSSQVLITDKTGEQTSKVQWSFQGRAISLVSNPAKLPKLGDTSVVTLMLTKDIGDTKKWLRQLLGL